uniref:Uncharacterized protein n=1 Tax=Candidatus Kentrum sp. DK TaxID=2126562 RepID=A0A450RTY5_9GAMM|nr:MAG: hypothetical protein BECKDK2373C_GA0170839_100199 [Candidatus Kentron sp. DK]
MEVIREMRVDKTGALFPRYRPGARVLANPLCNSSAAIDIQARMFGPDLKPKVTTYHPRKIP